MKSNFLISLKKFFTNKNTITILCVIAAVLVLWWGYNYRIKQQTSPIRVPYAKVEIQPRTLITEDMVDYVNIPRSMLTKNTIVNIKEVVGKYSNYDVMIPVGSIFYNNTVVTWKELPVSEWTEIPEGYTVVSLNVNTETTFGNSIFPGNYIDLYYATYDDSGKLLLGKLIESIEVLAVKDSSGKNVFENSSGKLKPNTLIFAVPEDMHLLLRKAGYLSGELFPVQRNKSYSENPLLTTVSSEYIQDYILSQTVILPEQVNANNSEVGTIR